MAIYKVLYYLAPASHLALFHVTLSSFIYSGHTRLLHKVQYLCTSCASAEHGQAKSKTSLGCFFFRGAYPALESK